MPLAVEDDVPANPRDVRLLCAAAVVSRPNASRTLSRKRGFPIGGEGSRTAKAGAPWSMRYRTGEEL